MENEQIKIALSGYKFSGKDHCADYLQSKYAYKIFSFSDQHKNIAHQLFPWLEFDYPSDQKEEVVYENPETGVQYTPRMIWELLDVLPTIDPAINVAPLDVQAQMFIQSLSQYTTPARIVIKDIRRPSELEYVVKNGYTIVYIDSPESLKKESVELHKSEILQPTIKLESDFVVYNDKKTNAVYKDLDKVVEHVESN